MSNVITFPQQTARPTAAIVRADAASAEIVSLDAVRQTRAKQPTSTGHVAVSPWGYGVTMGNTALDIDLIADADDTLILAANTNTAPTPRVAEIVDLAAFRNRYAR